MSNLKLDVLEIFNTSEQYQYDFFMKHVSEADKLFDNKNIEVSLEEDCFYEESGLQYAVYYFNRTNEETFMLAFVGENGLYTDFHETKSQNSILEPHYIKNY